MHFRINFVIVFVEAAFSQNFTICSPCCDKRFVLFALICIIRSAEYKSFVILWIIERQFHPWLVTDYSDEDENFQDLHNCIKDDHAQYFKPLYNEIKMGIVFVFHWMQIYFFFFSFLHWVFHLDHQRQIYFELKREEKIVFL